MPIVNAAINIDPLGKNEYNLGDKVILSGRVVPTSPVQANLKFLLRCGLTDVPLGMKIVNLDADDEYSFSNLVTLSNVEGNCNFVVFLEKNNVILEQRSSNTFVVSKELKGTFEIRGKKYQLGDTVIFDGQITKMDNSPIDGLAVISLKQDDNLVGMETVEVLSGIINFEYLLDSMPAGNYSVDVDASDNFGNKKLFGNILNFDVTRNLVFDIGTDSFSYDPEKKAIVSGFVTGEVNSNLGEVIVTGTYDYGEVSAVLRDGMKSFSLEFILPKDIKSGEHELIIKAKDNRGNYGEKSLKYNVNAVPTTLDILPAINNVNPGDGLEYSIDLLDQAGDLIQDTVMFKVYDNNGKLSLEGSVESNKKGLIEFPQFALPGEWKLESTYLNLKSEKKVIVNKLKKLESNLKGVVLNVRNVGNVIYQGTFDILANGVKKGVDINLNVNQSIDIDLSKTLESGNYTIDVPLTGESYGNIQIEDTRGLVEKLVGKIGDENQITGYAISGDGKQKKSFVWVFVFLILLVGGFAYFYFKREKEDDKYKETPEQKERAIKEGKEMAGELRGRDRDEKKYKFNFGKADEKDVEEFKKRMSKMVREEEERQKKEKERTRFGNRGFSGELPNKDKPVFGSLIEEAKKTESNEKKDEPKKSMFSMFD